MLCLFASIVAALVVASFIARERVRSWGHDFNSHVSTASFLLAVFVGWGGWQSGHWHRGLLLLTVELLGRVSLLRRLVLRGALAATTQQ